jgi:urea transport system ATP-binding protein
VFENQTVRDNLELALAGTRAVRDALHRGLPPTATRALTNCSRSSRLDLCGRPAGDLSHGQKQWLEIGMLLAQDPKLLLVDEPAAGMTDSETVETARLLREISRIIRSLSWSTTCPSCATLT